MWLHYHVAFAPRISTCDMSNFYTVIAGGNILQASSAEGENILASLFEDGIVSFNHCIADGIPSIFRLHEPTSAFAHFAALLV